MSEPQHWSGKKMEILYFNSHKVSLPSSKMDDLPEKTL